MEQPYPPPGEPPTTGIPYSSTEMLSSTHLHSVLAGDSSGIQVPCLIKQINDILDVAKQIEPQNPRVALLCKFLLSLEFCSPFFSMLRLTLPGDPLCTVFPLCIKKIHLY
jgi:hypothetical protein